MAALKEKMSRGKAVEEANRFVAARGLLPPQIKDLQDNYDALVVAIQYGRVTVNESGEIVQKLAHPIGDNVKELKYALRIKVGDYNKRLKSARINSRDVDDRIMALVATLTNQTTGVIDNMDFSDYTHSQNIAVFFQ